MFLNWSSQHSHLMSLGSTSLHRIKCEVSAFPVEGRFCYVFHYILPQEV